MMQDSVEPKTRQHTIPESIMFLKQPKPPFLPSSNSPAINLARKDTATEFQRHYALCDI